MILESLKPELLDRICRQIEFELAALDNEIEQYERTLRGSLDDSQRQRLLDLQAGRARSATLLRARLDVLCDASYQDNPQEIWNKSLLVA